MKIVITGDLHLTTRKDNPERYRTLEDILSQMIEGHINAIIISGDLFDASSQSYADFEALCRDHSCREIKFYIIPGNHDIDINNTAIVADNVHVITEPELVPVDPDGPDFLFLPYGKYKTMGEGIAPFAPGLAPDKWILIGHGDWAEGLREINPYEPGVYMPLTREDVRTYRPAKVFLGHIHKPLDRQKVHYVGSPGGLDITETGRRRFLVYDTGTDEVEPQFVDTDVIYFNESLVILPVEDERTYLREEIESRIASWGICEEDCMKVQVRVKVRGYSSDRRSLMQTLNECFRGYSFYMDEEPDISEVYVSNDLDRSYIAERVRGKISGFEWASGLADPDKEQIMLAALRVIYGE